jgi:hypothetical protein
VWFCCFFAFPSAGRAFFDLDLAKEFGTCRRRKSVGMCTTTAGRLQEDDDGILRYLLTMEGEAAREGHETRLHVSAPTNNSRVNQCRA